MMRPDERARSWLLGALVWLSLAGAARAQGAGDPDATAEADQGHALVSMSVGYGMSTGVNVFGLGVGVRAGYILPIRVYVGALGDFNLGTHDPGEGDVHHYAHFAGLELGYDLAAHDFHFLPGLRGGIGYVSTPRDVNDRFYSPWLGASAACYGQFGHVHVGAEVEVRQLTRTVNNGDNAFGITAIALRAFAGATF
jgi:hypothetical protein